MRFRDTLRPASITRPRMDLEYLSRPGDQRLPRTWVVCHWARSWTLGEWLWHLSAWGRPSPPAMGIPMQQYPKRPSPSRGSRGSCQPRGAPRACPFSHEFGDSSENGSLCRDSRRGSSGGARCLTSETDLYEEVDLLEPRRLECPDYVDSRGENPIVTMHLGQDRLCSGADPLIIQATLSASSLGHSCTYNTDFVQAEVSSRRSGFFSLRARVNPLLL